MSTTDSFPEVVEASAKDETSSPRYEEKWFNLQHERLLLEPNSDFVSETQINHVNGNSNTLKVNSDQLLLFPPPLPFTKEHFKILQKWEGYVLEVGSETFLARLIPIVGENADQEAEIFLDELDEEDRALIEPGAVFYWSIGYLDGPSGRRRDSVIRFRRLPPWTKKDLDKARAKAIELRNFLDAD